MVAVAVTLIVVAAGFTVLSTTNRALRANSQVVDTQQNVRVAMEMISRDVKMAGYGMIGPVGACNTAIVPADNNPAGQDAGPDSVSVVVPTTSSVAPLWTLAASVGPGVNQITLQAGAVGPATTPGTMQAAGLAVNSVISLAGTATATVSVIGGNTLTLNPPLGGPATFPAGTAVYLLQCVTYQVIPSPDPNNVCAGHSPCLARGVTAALNCNVASSPCVAITDGIEDLQLAYACDGCTAANGGFADGIIDDQNASNSFDQGDFLYNTTWATPPLTPGTIQLVQITIVARQTAVDQGLGEGASTAMVLSSPAAVATPDHNPVNDPTYSAATYSQYRRRLLVRTVDTRNIHLL